MQPLLGREAREVADAEDTAAAATPFVAGQVDAQRRHGDPVGRDPEQLRHDRYVEGADRDERVDVGDLPPNQIERPAPVGLDEPIEKEILTLQRTAHGAVQRLPQRPHSSYIRRSAPA